MGEGLTQESWQTVARCIPAANTLQLRDQSKPPNVIWGTLEQNKSLLASESLYLLPCVCSWINHDWKSGSDFPVMIQQVQKICFERTSEVKVNVGILLVHAKAVCEKRSPTALQRRSVYKAWSTVCSVVCVISAYSALIDANGWTTRGEQMASVSYEVLGPWLAACFDVLTSSQKSQNK